VRQHSPEAALAEALSPHLQVTMGTWFELRLMLWPVAAKTQAQLGN
jgi:hypothetical protein